jgi:hypothetical protein
LGFIIGWQVHLGFPAIHNVKQQWASLYKAMMNSHRTEDNKERGAQYSIFDRSNEDYDMKFSSAGIGIFR